MLFIGLIFVDGNGNKEYGEIDVEDKDVEEIYLDYSFFDVGKGNFFKLVWLDEIYFFSMVLVVNKDEN